MWPKYDNFCFLIRFKSCGAFTPSCSRTLAFVFLSVHEILSICQILGEKFKSGFLSIHNSPREGRPNFVVTKDSVCQVKTLVLEDRRVTDKQLAAITKMSVGSIETILHDHLHMSKVSARWVPRLLTPNQKEQRADSCKARIEL